MNLDDIGTVLNLAICLIAASPLLFIGILSGNITVCQIIDLFRSKQGEP